MIDRTAPGPSTPSLDDRDPERFAAVRTALSIRLTEERLLELFAQGKVFGTVHTCVGQEMSAVAVAAALREGDYVLSNHRCHGHYIACTDDIEGLIAEVMGKETGACGGRGGSQHLFRGTFLSNGVLGGMSPVAAGLALAAKLRGEERIVVLFVGDGALGEGALYEALNLIGRWSLPVLVVLENNGYAQSTSQSETTAGSIRGRAEAVGIRTECGSTWEWEALLALARSTIDDVRALREPRFLQIDTYRLGPHSKGDDNRDPAELATYVERDPINRMLGSCEELTRLRAELSARIDDAVAAADSAPLQAIVSGPEQTDGESWHELRFEQGRMVGLIRRALSEAMEGDERVLLVGEDIRSPYGGAFKVTEGLSDEHPERVFNTPVSEAGIVGVGSGLALSGRRPIVEIMFGDFVMLASDQLINHAAKFQWMYNDQVRVPLVLRTPMGGRRGYGPTHSQSLEKHLLGVPGLRVLNVHPRYSPHQLYRDLIETVDRPTLVIEGKTLYGQQASDRVEPGFVLERGPGRFPAVRIRPALDAAELTIVAYGGMVPIAELAMLELFTDHELLAEIVIPAQLYPLDPAPFVASVARTGRILVAEEGQGFAGFGSELIAQLTERLARRIVARRIAAAPHPIPNARPLEELSLPNSGSLVEAALDAAYG